VRVVRCAIDHGVEFLINFLCETRACSMVYMNILVYPKSMEIKWGENFRSDVLLFFICVLYN
jgi:hypothetical protein